MAGAKEVSLWAIIYELEENNESIRTIPETEGKIISGKIDTLFVSPIQETETIQDSTKKEMTVIQEMVAVQELEAIQETATVQEMKVIQKTKEMQETKEMDETKTIQETREDVRIKAAKLPAMLMGTYVSTDFAQHDTPS